MAIIEPTKRKLESRQGKYYPPSTRLWHWVNLLIISGSLITVLINSTLLDRSQQNFVSRQLLDVGANVTDKQASSVTHGLEDQVWGIHIYFGYALAAIFAFRLIAEFFLPPAQKFLPKLQRCYRSYFILKKERTVAKHELVVKGLYVLFYLLLVIMVSSGLLMALADYTGIPEAVTHSIKEVHGFCMYLILAFIVLHLAGVFLAELKDGKGIVSDMINGGGTKQP